MRKIIIKESELIKLIETAQKYVENIQNDSNPVLIKKLQIKWKEIGNAGRFAEQKLWKKFRHQCDSFFEVKNQTRIANISAEKENLIAKKTIIDKFKKLETGLYLFSSMLDSKTKPTFPAPPSFSAKVSNLLVETPI
mgnify:CR=1 FL=1